MNLGLKHPSNNPVQTRSACDLWSILSIRLQQSVSLSDAFIRHHAAGSVVSQSRPLPGVRPGYTVGMLNDTINARVVDSKSGAFTRWQRSGSTSKTAQSKHTLNIVIS